MVSLLDVNVLVALLVPEHEQHTLALDWFASEAATVGWATCTVTELGVIRVCAQLPGGAWPPETTADRLLMLTAVSREYVWWADAVSPAVLPEVRSAGTGKQVTDRYLLGLARRNGGQLAAFDRTLAAVGGRDVVWLVAGTRVAERVVAYCASRSGSGPRFRRKGSGWSKPRTLNNH